MPKLTLIYLVVISAVGIWLVLDIGRIFAQSVPQVECEVSNSDGEEIPEGTLIAAGTKIQVECLLNMIAGNLPLGAKSELIGFLRWSLTDVSGTHRLVGNPVDLSQHEGQMVLTLEGTAPLKQTRRQLTGVIEEGQDKISFWANTSPSDSVRLVSFGQGNPFDSYHIERTVAHPMSISLMQEMDALEKDNPPQPLLDLAHELVDTGRPWDAQALLDAMNKTGGKGSWWANSWAQRVYGFLAGLVVVVLVVGVISVVRQLKS